MQMAGRIVLFLGIMDTHRTQLSFSCWEHGTLATATSLIETFSRGNLSAYIPFPYLSLCLMINSSSFIIEKNVQKGTSEPWKNNEAQSKMASVILMEVLMGPWGVLLGLGKLAVAMNKAIKIDRCLGPL